MEFEWDGEKRKINIKKHDIDFADVPSLFEGPMLVQLDGRDAYGEDRWIGAGVLKGMVAVVVFTERRDGEVVRIISARKATKDEREHYEKEISNQMEETQSDEG